MRYVRTIRSKPLRCAAVTAAVASLASATALPAHAFEDPATQARSLSVSPTVVPAGADVEVQVHGCAGAKADAKNGAKGAAERAAERAAKGEAKSDAKSEAKGAAKSDAKDVATSEAFVADAELAAGAERDALSARATVRATTAPGTYKVTSSRCGVEGSVTVLPASSASPDSSASPAVPAFPAVPGDSYSSSVATPLYPSPSAPVRAGGGGTARAAEQDDGPGAAEVIFGLGLAGGAVVAVAGIAAARRRRSGSTAE